MIRVTLPWPVRPLWPNAKAHWSKKAPAIRKAKADADVLVLQAMGFRPRIAGPETVAVAICFRPPSRRRYDLDNALAACKGALDGIAGALHVDDSRFRLTLERGEPIKRGAVVVTITTPEQAIAAVGA